MCGTSTEASLVAKKLVEMAVTEDMFGEQRINAMFNGVFAFSASPNRIPSQSLQSVNAEADCSLEGPKVTQSRVCFTARRVEDIRHVYSVISESRHCEKIFTLNPTSTRLPFNEDIFYGDNPLKIAYFDT